MERKRGWLLNFYDGVHDVRVGTISFLETEKKKKPGRNCTSIF